MKFEPNLLSTTPYCPSINYQVEFFQSRALLLRTKQICLKFTSVIEFSFVKNTTQEHTGTLSPECFGVCLCFPLCSDVVFFTKLNLSTEVKLGINLLRSQQQCSRLKKFKRIVNKGIVRRSLGQVWLEFHITFKDNCPIFCLQLKVI